MSRPSENWSMLSEGENKFNLLACGSKVVVAAQLQSPRLVIERLWVRILRGAGLFYLLFRTCVLSLCSVPLNRSLKEDETLQVFYKRRLTVHLGINQA